VLVTKVYAVLYHMYMYGLQDVKSHYLSTSLYDYVASIEIRVRVVHLLG